MWRHHSARRRRISGRCAAPCPDRSRKAGPRSPPNRNRWDRSPLRIRGRCPRPKTGHQAEKAQRSTNPSGVVQTRISVPCGAWAHRHGDPQGARPQCPTRPRGTSPAGNSSSSRQDRNQCNWRRSRMSSPPRLFCPCGSPNPPAGLLMTSEYQV